MATKGFKQPFQITNSDGQWQVLDYREGANRGSIAFQSASFAEANNEHIRLTAQFQTDAYGGVDPGLSDVAKAREMGFRILSPNKVEGPRENRIPVMFSDDELASIDDYQHANKIATKAGAIRKLCQIGMAGFGYDEAKKLPNREALKVLILECMLEMEGSKWQ